VGQFPRVPAKTNGELERPHGIVCSPHLGRLHVILFPFTDRAGCLSSWLATEALRPTLGCYCCGMGSWPSGNGGVFFSVEGLRLSTRR
jgi:hypothetical protein